MGGFYGSIQVRTDNRDAVVQATADAAKTAGIRCLIGPPLNGWVGVYPEDAGQDQSVGQAIARDVGGDVLHVVVHNDDVMAYWFWHDGELDDSYWSNPGYFDPADRTAQEQLTGDPIAFGPLLEGRAAEMMKILDRQHRDITFEATRLQQFAELLGIHNAVSSYEYLKAGDRVGIEGWEAFIEVPTEAVAAERAALRERRRIVEGRKNELKRACLLFADVVEQQLMPKACAAAGGILTAWEGFGRGDSRVDFYRFPWGDAEPGEIETGGQINAVAADAAGRRVALALGNRVVVWDADSWNPILELVENDWAVQTALSSDGRLMAYASRERVYVHDVNTGQRITALAAHEEGTLAFHPLGDWLVSAGAAVWIAQISGKEPWRELYPGGQTPLPKELSQAVQQEMERVNVAAMEKKWRDTLEAAIARLAATSQNPAVTEQLAARMRQQMEKQVEQMHANLANLKAGKLPPPRQGNEQVICAGFARGGAQLWLGTDLGIRLYDWSAVAAAAARTAMPAPVLSHDPSASGSTAPGQSLIYAAVEVAGRPSMLFGGYGGRICHWDLNNGAVRELATLPDGGAIVGLTLSADLTALGVCSRPALGENGDPQDERAVWQIWSYPALIGQPVRRSNLSPEIVLDTPIEDLP